MDKKKTGVVEKTTRMGDVWTQRYAPGVGLGIKDWTPPKCVAGGQDGRLQTAILASVTLRFFQKLSTELQCTFEMQPEGLAFESRRAILSMLPAGTALGFRAKTD